MHGPVQHNFNLNALSPDGARWAIGGWNANSNGGEVSLCEGGACVLLDVGSRGPSSWIGGIAFDPSGSLLAVGTGDGQVLFFNGRSGVRLGPAITAHSGGVTTFAFSRDGKMMASGGRGGAVLLWDISTQQPIGTPIPGPLLDQVSALLFEPDGRYLLAKYQAGVIKLNVDMPEYWQARACQVAGRDLSLSEWNLHGSGSPFEAICANNPHPPSDWEPRPPAPF